MDFFQILVVASPGSYARAYFECLKKKWILLRIFFLFVNMGPYGRKNFKTLLLLQIAVESFQLLLEFLPKGPHKTVFRIFEILKIKSLTNFVRFR